MTAPLRQQLGLCIMYPAPGILERIGSDWDWIWLDAQHGQIVGYDTLLAMVRACQFIGKPAFVRIPGHDPSWISLALDMGADAVIVPQVESPDQAAALVQAAKFPPLGDRSFGGRRVIDLHGRGYYTHANSQARLICQIESPTALEQADKIAELPGVDGLFLGPDDLLLRSGVEIAGSNDNQLLAEATHRLASICRPLTKMLLTVGAGDATLQLAVDHGATHIVAGGDVGFLATGSKTASTNARRILDANEAASPSMPGTTSQSLY